MSDRTLAPVSVIAASFCAGIWLSDVAEWPTAWFWMVSVIAIAAAVGLSRLKCRRTTSIVLLLVVAACGGFRHSLQLWRPDRDLANLTDQLSRDDRVLLAVTGRVASFVVEDSSRIRFDLAATEVHAVHSVVRVTGNVRVTMRRPPPQCRALRRGMRVFLRGFVYRPTSRRNPGGFDYREYLSRRGLHSLLRVRASTGSCLILDSSFDAVSAVRRWFSDAIAQTIPESSRPLAAALIVADRSALNPATRREFAHSGLMHLLAISGLHVFFVGMTLYGLIRTILNRVGCGWYLAEFSSVGLTLLVLTGYSLMTGASASVVRASVMAGVFLSAAPLHRYPSSVNSLGTAALVILMIDSNQLFTSGFQLSFSAVFGLVTAGIEVTRRLNRRIVHRSLRWIAGMVAVSTVATLSTAPVMLHHFGYVPTPGLVLNLAAIPIASFLLISSILTTLMSGVLPAVAGTMGYGVHLLSDVLLFLAEIGASTEDWSLLTIGRSRSALVFPALLVLAGYPGIRKVKQRLLVLFALALPTVEIIAGAAAGTYLSRMTITFFDVGHGDAALVVLPSRRTVLIDAGARSPSHDYGEDVIIPYLRRSGIRKLDAIVVSHPDADHLGGVPSVIRAIPTACVYDNGKITSTKLFQDYRSVAGNRVGCRTTLTAGRRLHLDPQTRIEVLAPAGGYHAANENDASLVIRVSFGQFSVLFTGDIESRAETQLSRHQCARLASTIVKIPHHGSRTSSNSEFVRCTQAASAIISVGNPRRFGLPDEDVIERWDKAGADVKSTRQSGYVQVETNGTEYRIFTNPQAP